MLELKSRTFLQFLINRLGPRNKMQKSGTVPAKAGVQPAFEGKDLPQQGGVWGLPISSVVGSVTTHSSATGTYPYTQG
jgi:hypothetical protein